MGKFGWCSKCGASWKTIKRAFEPDGPCCICVQCKVDSSYRTMERVETKDNYMKIIKTYTEIDDIREVLIKVGSSLLDVKPWLRVHFQRLGEGELNFIISETEYIREMDLFLLCMISGGTYIEVFTNDMTRLDLILDSQEHEGYDDYEGVEIER